MRVAVSVCNARGFRCEDGENVGIAHVCFFQKYLGLRVSSRPGEIPTRCLATLLSVTIGKTLEK